MVHTHTHTQVWGGERERESEREREREKRKWSEEGIEEKKHDCENHTHDLLFQSFDRRTT